MEAREGPGIPAGARGVRIRGSRLLLRALRPGEIEEEWQAMAAADPMVVAELPDEAAFRARLQRSGHLADGWLDLAIDLDGTSIGHIQTFVPPGRPLPPGTFEIGISLREHARGQGYGREALALLTNWLFEHAGAAALEAETDAANTAMRTVFQRAGWTLAGPVTDSGREWMMYRITRPQWEHHRSRAIPGKYRPGRSGRERPAPGELAGRARDRRTPAPAAGKPGPAGPQRRCLTPPVSRPG